MSAYADFGARFFGATGVTLMAAVMIGMLTEMAWQLLFAENAFNDETPLVVRRCFGIAVAMLLWPTALYIAFQVVP